MKKNIYILGIVLGFALSSNAQIESLAGPRLGTAYITSSITSGFLNNEVPLFDDKMPKDYKDGKGAITSLYGWQFESRFADGGDITGIVEWVVLAAGMEKGKFLPSFSSLVGARTSSGLEFAVGPNLSIGGIAMVFGMGYNFKVGELNMPVNFAFVPGRKSTREIEGIWEDVYYDPDGIPDNGDEYWEEEVHTSGPYNVDYHTGNRFSITFGFNLGR
ncbi:MAG: hypothetical protein HN677_04590 [Flavobacteriales bacterium]|nr:hypothetical protein [Flavobacteriales bacterium]